MRLTHDEYNVLTAVITTHECAIVTPTLSQLVRFIQRSSLFEDRNYQDKELRRLICSLENHGLVEIDNEHRVHYTGARL